MSSGFALSEAAVRIEHASAAEWPQRKPTAIVGRHPLLESVLARVTRFAASDRPVLITGETGTGKELFARALFLAATRSRRVFLTVNCAQYVGTELVASELFGHRRGSFTGAVGDHRGLFEEADGGFLFLDEIGDLPLQVQAMLLRTLGEGEIVPVGGSRAKQVNVRVVAATSRDLREMVEEGTFRADLYYRLRQLHVQVPALRDRGDDWRLIAGHYLSALNANGGPPKLLGSEVMDGLEGHPWPGNVREVISCVETGFHLADDAEIRYRDLFEGLEDASRRLQFESLRVSHTAERCARMVSGEESFWEVIHVPFLERELNRAEVREVVAHGLDLAAGSYKRMLEVFGIDAGDYLKMMDFLRHHRLKPERDRGGHGHADGAAAAA